MNNNLDMSGSEEDDQMNMMEDLRRGPWTVEEDFTLINYIAHHGEGRWNSLARCAGMFLYFFRKTILIHNTYAIYICLLMRLVSAISIEVGRHLTSTT